MQIRKLDLDVRLTCQLSQYTNGPLISHTLYTTLQDTMDLTSDIGTIFMSADTGLVYIGDVH